MDDPKRAYHRLKLRLRRNVRRQKRQVEEISEQADDSLNKYVFKRFSRLANVKRFVAGWTALVLFIGLGAAWQVRGLDRFYLALSPVPGGVYREGLIGHFTTANPIFAVGAADVAVSRLVFSGLFRLAPDGVLEPDLAVGYEVDERGLVYTVNLRRDVKWHDGEQFDASDVVFTYDTIRNPTVKSPLQAGWVRVDVEAKDDHTVVFTLPNALSSFPFSLSIGILPEHELSRIAPADLRSSTFNTVDPIGTGPFLYKSVEVLSDDVDNRREKITLEKNEAFYRSPAQIDGISLRTFRDEDSLLSAFEKKEISAMVGLQSVPDYVLQDETVTTFSSPLSSQVMLFMNNSTDILKDAKVRQALLRGTDTKKIRERIGYQLVEADSPFLKSHFTYDETKTQAGYDSAEADKLLNEGGWLRAEDGLRKKDGKTMRFKLVSQSLTEYATVVQELQEQWKALGIEVEAVLQPEEDIQSGAVSRHDYDVLLYGISLGPDPDVFPYWHSTQADVRLKTRLNLSEYKSPVADAALEGGRTRVDKELRKAKYAPFVDAWLADVPAIALYQPRFLFVERGTLEGYRTGQFTSPADRLYSINDWQIRRDRVIK